MSLYDSDREDTTIYRVVVNHEEQYSIWPEYRELPPGWREAGKSGLKPDCLAYIKEVWTDLRPLSLRRQMETAASEVSQKTRQSSNELGDSTEGPDLVRRLSEGRHPVESSLRPERTARALKDRIDLGHVHLKFTETRGGTELGVTLDRNAVDLSKSDFENRTGTVHLEGELILDNVKVRCIADIDLQTLNGQGYLVPVQTAVSRGA